MKFLFVSVGNIQEVSPFLSIESNLVHRLLLYLLAEPQIVDIIGVLNVTLLVHFIAHILYDPRHLLVNDTFVNFGSALSTALLIVLEIHFLPGTVSTDSHRYRFVQLEVV